jgi:hypothetical protein
MADHAALIKFEKALASSLAGDTNVDGHDMGSDEMKIFVETDDPVRTFAEVEAVMRTSSLWTDMRAAYREIDRDDYTVVWPPGLSAFRVT